MSLSDMFAKNGKLVVSTQKTLLSFLTSHTKTPVTAKPPVFRKSDTAYTVTNMALLRLNQKKNTSPIIIGSCQPDFQKAFYDLIAPVAGSPAVEPKAVENELLKALFATVEIEFNNKGWSIDPQTAICLTQKVLGSWSTVSTTESVQFPFTTPTGELVFEIPIFTEEFTHQKTIAVCGFPFNARILVVDDAPTTRKLVKYHLASAGYLNMEECEDGLVAYNKILVASPKFDLIVADWHMPRMTGLELLRKIRMTYEQHVSNLPVLLVTGEKNQEEVLKALRDGVSGYVVKPFDGETLYKAMNKAAKAHAPKAAAKQAA